MFLRKLTRLCYTYRYLIYSSTLTLIVLMHYLLKFRILCWNFHAKENANQVCNLFETGAASGSLCMPLCVREEIESITCYSYRSTRKVKFRGKYKGTELVFKSPTESSPFHWYDNGKLKYPSEKQFETTLKAVIKNKLNIDLPVNTIMRITNIKFQSKEHTDARRKEMDALSTLVQDDEFLILSIFPGNAIFPRLIGTCGAFYATEYLEPVKITSPLITLTDDVNEWIQKLQISAQILEILKKLQTEFHEPIHLCDVELQHFGIYSEDESLRFLDLDHVYPKSIIGKILRNIPCRTDDDCDFLDCRGRCDVTTKMCRASVANDNFQIVCEKIFLGWRRSNTVIVPGLLMSQHTPSDLAAILRQCSNPGHEAGKVRMSPEDLVTKRMYELIVEIEQTVVSQMTV